MQLKMLKLLVSNVTFRLLDNAAKDVKTFPL